MKRKSKGLLWTLIFCTVSFIFVMKMPNEEQVKREHYVTMKEGQYYVDTRPRHLPSDFCTSEGLLLVMVQSKPSNVQRRNIIRNTWGAKYYKSLFFLLGGTTDADVQTKINSESSQYGDIIQEDFNDSYSNRSLKSVFMLKHALIYCPNHRYLLKADDDTFVILDNVRDLLPASSPELLLGYLHCWAQPYRNSGSRGSKPTTLNREQYYPDYVAGGAYLMSKYVAERLYQAAMKTPIFPVEDVYVTGICAERAGILPKHSDLFATKTKLLKHSDWCTLKTLCAVFNLSVDEMFKLQTVLANWGLHSCEGGFSSALWLMNHVLTAKNRPAKYRTGCM